MTQQTTDERYDAEVDKWLAACERCAPPRGDGYSSHNMDAMLAAREALAVAAAAMGLRLDTSTEIMAALYRSRGWRVPSSWLAS